MAKERSSNSKSTGRALLASFLALLLCLSTLLGTTFAWFTDSASTGVNTIKAGNLDVELQYNNSLTETADWLDAQGVTAIFKQSGQESLINLDNVLWEPGATFETAQLKVVNNGSLAAKYKIEVAIKDANYADGTSIGASKLNECFTVTVGNNSVIADTDGSFVYTSDDVTLYPTSVANSDGDKFSESDAFTVKIGMNTSAGNEFQNMTVGSVQVIMVATQATGESDSYNNEYDEYAAYVYPVNHAVEATAAVSKDSDGETKETTVIAYADTATNTQQEFIKVTVPAGAIAENATEIKVTATPTTTDGTIEVSTGQSAISYDIDVTGLKKDNEAAISVAIFIGYGLNQNSISIKHTTDSSTVEEITITNYDESTGIVTFTTTSFSPFTFLINAACKINDTYYSSINKAISEANDNGTVYVLTDYSDNSGVAIKNVGGKAVTVDLGGHIVGISTSVKNYTVLCGNENSTLILKNGTITTGIYNAIVETQGGYLTVENVNVEVKNGGANAFNLAGRGAYIHDSEITINSSNCGGIRLGAVSNSGGDSETLSVENTVFNVTNGYGIRVYGNNNSITVNDCIFEISEEKTVADDKKYAGILCGQLAGGNTVNVVDTRISANGAGVFNDANTSKNVFNITNTEIKSKYYGVYLNGNGAPNSVTLDGCTIENEKSNEMFSRWEYTGAGVYISNSASAEKQTLTIKNSTIKGSTAVEVKHTNVDVCNSTLIATASNIKAMAYGNGQCTDGYSLAVTSNGTSDNASGSVVVDEATAKKDKFNYFVYTLGDSASVKIAGEDAKQSSYVS